MTLHDFDRHRIRSAPPDQLDVVAVEPHRPDAAGKLGSSDPGEVHPT